jgi:hypothetical protein
MRITRKTSGRRPRVQFYLNEELDRLLTDNRKLAKKLGFRVDYQEEFRIWFLKQNLDAQAKLSKLVEQEKKKNGDAQAD